MHSLADRAAEWARQRPDVRAAFVVGSHARTDAPADAYSDLDLVLVVDEPAAYLLDATWVGAFGDPLLTFIEPTAVRDGFERRVLYVDGQDVDVAIIPAASARDWLEGEVARILSRGYRMLMDEMSLEPDLARAAADAPPARPPTEDDLEELGADVWYHGLWSARKLRRGELFVAKECVDGYMKARLVRLLRWHALAAAPELDTWHGARFLERWADPRSLDALRGAFAYYDRADVARALRATLDLYGSVERETAERLGHDLGFDRAEIRSRIDELL